MSRIATSREIVPAVLQPYSPPRLPFNLEHTPRHTYDTASSSCSSFDEHETSSVRAWSVAPTDDRRVIPRAPRARIFLWLARVAHSPAGHVHRRAGACVFTGPVVARPSVPARAPPSRVALGASRSTPLACPFDYFLGIPYNTTPSVITGRLGQPRPVTGPSVIDPALGRQRHRAYLRTKQALVTPSRMHLSLSWRRTWVGRGNKKQKTKGGGAGWRPSLIRECTYCCLSS